MSYQELASQSSSATRTASTLDDHVLGLLADASIDDHLAGGAEVEVWAEVERVCRRAEAHDGDALLTLHTTLYHLYTANYEVPWKRRVMNVTHPFLLRVRRRLEKTFRGAYISRLPPALRSPVSPDKFAAWATDFVLSHSSNELHPLFAFLRDKASVQTLREFHRQETPFDIYFGDLLCSMMPGFSGAARIEFASNYWDEMGRGAPQGMHRALRLRLMSYFDIPHDSHLSDTRNYVWEELALANMYLGAVLDRSRLAEAIGMMLATELAVPGRIECQLEGCRRVGIPEDRLVYLAEHTVVDVEHAHGWMNRVTLPLLVEHPECAEGVVFGLYFRLELAHQVCDRMLAHLRAFGRAGVAS